MGIANKLCLVADDQINWPKIYGWNASKSITEQLDTETVEIRLRVKQELRDGQVRQA